MTTRLAHLPLFLFVFLTGCSNESEQSAQPPAPTVQVMTVEPTNVAVFGEIVATLDGKVNTFVRPKVEGYLLTQEYSDGTAVTEGQLLFTIDPDTLEIAVQGAAADLEEAKAQLVKTQITVERDKELIKADAISQKQLDNAIQSEQAAQANVEAAEAALNNAKLNLSYAKVYSPINGIAGKAQADIGDLVGPSSTLAVISNLDPIQAVFYIPEKAYLENATELQRILNKPFEERPSNLELIFGNNQTYAEKGKLQFINRQIDSGTGTIGVFALFPNEDNFLRPGQYVKVRAQTQTLENAILVPQRALMETQGMFSVFVVNSDKTVSLTPVTRGITKGSNVVITKGLKDGDSVVIEGLQKASNGATVNPTPWKPTSGSGNTDDPPDTSDGDSSSSTKETTL
ncbi:MAG: efflux RND transporter periplasmic adaptor subunit [Verrucomicrobiota bacterium]